MKKHATHVLAGGIVAPIALALAVAIANEAQTLLGLHLDNVALAIYITPFLLGAAAIVHALVRLEIQRLINDLGSPGGLDLGALLGGLGDILGGEPTPSAPAAAPSPPPPAPGTLPPPPPPAP